MDTPTAILDAKSQTESTHSATTSLTGHYVPVNSTPNQDSRVRRTQQKLFSANLGFADSMAQSTDFVACFSGEHLACSDTDAPKVWLWRVGLRTLSNFRHPRNTTAVHVHKRNGYGDGRSSSLAHELHHTIDAGKMRLAKVVAGRHNCRGDGRSRPESWLECSTGKFLAQEHMHAASAMPTSRSLSFW